MRVGPSAERLTDIPVIGVFTGKIRDANRLNDAPSYAQSHLLIDAIKNAGGAPLLIPHLPDLSPAAFASLDAGLRVMNGFVLAGGPDVDSLAYGEMPHPETDIKGVSKERDKTEIHAIKRSEEWGIPVLAICRGLQIWVASEGGTLFQHLPDEVGGKIDHLNAGITDPGQRLHDITFLTESRLGRLMLPNHPLKRATAQVDSHHHQGPKDVPDWMLIVAHARDGVTEAIEHPDPERFFIGVQWHPETTPGDRLIEGLVAEAAMRQSVTLAAA